MNLEEQAFLDTQLQECTQCEHKKIFHNYHCCPYCLIPNCKCEDWYNTYFPKTKKEKLQGN